MDTIHIKDLMVAGIHGATEKERHAEQQFQVSVSMKARMGSHRTDAIEDALDYRLVKRIINGVIGTERFALLETIAHRLADRILAETPAYSVTVSVAKIYVWGNGHPAVTVTRNKIPVHLDLLDFDIEEVMERLLVDGGTSVPFLPEERRTLLLRDAATYPYIKQPEIPGMNGVIEEISSVSVSPPHVFPRAQMFHRLTDDMNEFFVRKFHSLGVPDLFATPLRFNDASLQHYAKGSVGITPHVDGKSRINLICVCILGGHAEFGLCSDRSSRNVKLLDTTPGNMILLRAPGFYHRNSQVMHVVRNVTTDRIVFGLRQLVKPEITTTQR
jgi:FolB domain-containing protein